MIYKKIVSKKVNQPDFIQEVGFKKSLFSLSELGEIYTENNEFGFGSVFKKKTFNLLKEEFLKEYYFKFFDPFVYFQDGQLFFLDSYANNCCVINQDYIQKISVKNAEFDSVELDFTCVWTETRKILMQKEVAVATGNFDVFVKKFDSFLNQFIWDKKYLNVNTQYHLVHEELVETTSFKLEFLIFFDYIIAHSQNFKIKYSKLNHQSLDSNIKSSVFNKTFQLKLPSKDLVNLWENRVQYYTNDFVEFESKYYKAKKDNNSDQFCFDDWIEIDFEAFSFANMRSLNKNNHGQKILDLLIKNIQFLIEKKIGNTLKITLLKKINEYKINDYFEYNNVRYRIIEIQEIHTSGVDTIEIVGLEILDINSEKLKDILLQDFDEQEPFINYCDISIHDSKFALDMNIPKTVILQQSKEVDLHV